jgi:YidC/Oxa1 family membrane protein insertase
MQRKMNEELQQLFKEEGVNPAGGCLPILLQIPVFLAFFNLLRSAVELWGAPWILWIDDLSVPDPYYVIPIVMGATQVLQQRMTPPPPNPSQAMVIKSMPIVFTIFSLRFPAGLVLYWLTNNLLTIVQQGGYNRLKKTGFFGGEPQEEKPKRSKAQQGKGRT